VPRHVEVDDPASVVGQKDKAINHLENQRCQVSGTFFGPQ
jgi:hypothetical protein